MPLGEVAAIKKPAASPAVLPRTGGRLVWLGGGMRYNPITVILCTFLGRIASVVFGAFVLVVFLIPFLLPKPVYFVSVQFLAGAGVVAAVGFSIAYLCHQLWRTRRRTAPYLFLPFVHPLSTWETDSLGAGLLIDDSGNIVLERRRWFFGNRRQIIPRGSIKQVVLRRFALLLPEPDDYVGTQSVYDYHQVLLQTTQDEIGLAQECFLEWDVGRDASMSKLVLWTKQIAERLDVPLKSEDLGKANQILGSLFPRSTADNE